MTLGFKSASFLFFIEMKRWLLLKVRKTISPSVSCKVVKSNVNGLKTVTKMFMWHFKQQNSHFVGLFGYFTDHPSPFCQIHDFREVVINNVIL